jgi:hypothetical protein
MLVTGVSDPKVTEPVRVKVKLKVRVGPEANPEVSPEVKPGRSTLGTLWGPVLVTVGL